MTLRISAIFLSWILICIIPPPVPAQDLYEVQKLVDDARLTFARFASHPNMTWLRAHIKEAKGLFIIPRATEAGYIIGGSLAHGVFLVRDEKTGSWSQPAFYTVVGGSFGLQFGVLRSQALVLVMTQKGLESLLGTTFVFGPGISVAVGPVGGGVSGGMTPGLATDFVTFARAKGAMINLSLGGSIVTVKDKAHRVYYGEEFDPADILLSGKVNNWYSDRIRKALTEATDGDWQPQ